MLSCKTVVSNVIILAIIRKCATAFGFELNRYCRGCSFTGNTFRRPSRSKNSYISFQTLLLAESVEEWNESLAHSDSSRNNHYDNGDNNSWEENEGIHENNNAGEDGPLLLEEYSIWSSAVEESLNGVSRKMLSLKNELQKAQGAEETVARAQLIINNLYMFTPGIKSARVPDWENDGIEVEIILDPKYESASAEADALYAQAKKLKRGSKVVQELLEETVQSLQLMEELQTDLKSAVIRSDNGSGDIGNEKGSVTAINEGCFRLVQDRLKRSSGKTNFQIPSDVEPPQQQKRQQTTTQSTGNKRSRKPEIGSPASNIRKLVSPGGCTILVGRNRRGNEYLTFHQARGEDIWMHARGTPGAHVLLLSRRGGPKPTDQCIQFAANLAAFYSDARTEAKAVITAAEPKHLLKPRGAPLGAVKLREEWKVFTGFPNIVPDDLKEARDQSGLSDEYRSKDKAKHRRRTREVRQKRDRDKKKAASQKRKSRDDHYDAMA